MALPGNRQPEPGNRLAGVRVLVVGLGASGASALRYLVAQGAQVEVTDSRATPAGLEDLRSAYPQVRFHLGAFEAPRPLTQFREAIVSPGVALDEPFVRELADAGVPVIGDIELFARAVAPGARVVGITGSNGKSTVTTLVGEMARAAGLRMAVGGNLGTPALDLLDDAVELYVLELSSFQLETTFSLRCDAAAWLNLSEDHLDRHGSMAHYARVKSTIYRDARVAVFNRDDAATRQGLVQAGRAVGFGLDAPAGGDGFGVVEVDGEPWLAHGPDALCQQSRLALRGRHNLANALAALALAEAAGIARAPCLRALDGFKGLPHRCELVAERGGVSWINDSKGTNVGSTLAALDGLDGPIVWLGGGQGKGQDFAPLARPLAEKGRAALVYGADAAAIREALLGVLPIHQRDTLLEALDLARDVAVDGDTVLLSPACASLDQFRNYIERGDTFRSWVTGGGA